MQEIRRAEALLVQARAGSMPSLMANATLLRLDGDRLLTSPGTAATATAPDVPPSSRNISPKNQQSANLLLNVPLVAPRAWTHMVRIFGESRDLQGQQRGHSADARDFGGARLPAHHFAEAPGRHQRTLGGDRSLALRLHAHAVRRRGRQPGRRGQGRAAACGRPGAVFRQLHRAGTGARGAGCLAGRRGARGYARRCQPA
jgi:hypothetical protein